MSIYLWVNEQQSGPYTEDHLRAMLAAGSISPAQLAWRDGLSEWQPLNTILTIAPIPPPPPTHSPSPPELKHDLVACKACGNPVSKSAKACPSCGAPIKRKSSRGGCLGLIVIFVIAGAIVAISSNNGASPGQPVVGIPAAAPAPSAVVTTPPPLPAPNTPATPPPPAKNTADQTSVPGAPSATPQPTPPSPVPIDTAQEVQSISDLIHKRASNIDQILSSIQVQGNTLKVITTDEFDKSPYQERLQLAQGLVKVWTEFLASRSPSGISSLSMADARGNEVGGTNESGAWVITQIVKANDLMGLTEQQVIDKLGKPIRVEKNDSPDGPFEMLVFNDSENASTFCTIFEKDGTTDGFIYKGGTVSSGSYRGIAFPAKSPDKQKGDEPARVARTQDGNSAAKDEKLFKATLNAADPNAPHFLASLSTYDDELILTMRPAFINAPYQARLQCAQNFLKLWQTIHKPTSDLNSMLSLVDANGNEIGGSGMMGVWVTKDQ